MANFAKSFTTIIEVLDKRFGRSSSLEYIKKGISAAITEELKVLIHQASVNIQTNEESSIGEELENLKKQLIEKDAQIRDLEQVIFELQSFYRSQADHARVLKQSPPYQAESLSTEESASLPSKQTFLGRFGFMKKGKEPAGNGVNRSFQDSS